MSELNIRDPIHGFIRLNGFEPMLVQTLPFQRLRFIHQLGTTSWVYPSGVQTRFEHSLGVLQISSSLLNRLKLLGLSLTREDKCVFRIASLLHDIGHAPFSHVAEDMSLFEMGLNHEIMGENIIRETELGEIISNKMNEYDLERIIFIITGKGKPASEFDTLFHFLLAGQAGIDRMDYLLRDSHFLGVAYGNFDLARLLETLRYDEESNVYWEEGGIHALEQFLLARYFMFTEVYYHKTRRILDYHLSKLLKEYLRANTESEFYPVDVENYLRLNDCVITSWMLNSDNKYKKIFLQRKFFRKIHQESSDHPEAEEVILWEWLNDSLKRQFDDNEFYFDKADNSPYKFEKLDIIIKDHDGPMPLGERSKLVKSLKPIQKRRIYSSETIKNELTDFVKDFLDKKGGA